MTYWKWSIIMNGNQYRSFIDSANIGGEDPPSEHIMPELKQVSYFGGSKKLNPVRRPPRCRSMHTSQWKIGPNPSDSYWDSHYKGTFVEKDIIPANRLHLTSLVNRIDQTEGGDMKDTIKANQEPTNYWSQYNRIHNKLGNTLGPGVPRAYPVRQSYNVLTGEEIGPAWKEENKRVSGNRVLYSARMCDDRYTLLG